MSTGGAPKSADFGWHETSQAEVYPGELLIYRYWRFGPSEKILQRDDGKVTRVLAEPALTGVAYRTYHWAHGGNKARCHRINAFLDHHSAPSSKCKCGFYGWYRPEDATRHLGNGSLGLNYGGLLEAMVLKSATVFGACQVSGKIVPGAAGVRASNARIVAIVVDPMLDSHCDMGSWVRENFPEVEIFSTKKKLVEKFPPQTNPWHKRQEFIVVAEFPLNGDALDNLQEALESTANIPGRRLSMSIETRDKLRRRLTPHITLGWFVGSVPLFLNDMVEGVRLEVPSSE